MSDQRSARHAQPSRRHQRGATLVITLVLMLLVGLAAMSSISGSERNLQIAGNMQLRNEALAASQAIIEQTISSTAFSRDPAAAAASVQAIDIDGDGRADQEVRLDPAPTCLRVQPIKVSELDPTQSADLACLGSSQQITGRDFNATGNGDSLCGDSLWNVSASVSDNVTGAQVRVHQGVSMRVATTDAQNACKS